MKKRGKEIGETVIRVILRMMMMTKKLLRMMIMIKNGDNDDKKMSNKILFEKKHSALQLRPARLC